MFNFTSHIWLFVHWVLILTSGWNTLRIVWDWCKWYRNGMSLSLSNAALGLVLSHFLALVYHSWAKLLEEDASLSSRRCASRIWYVIVYFVPFCRGLCANGFGRVLNNRCLFWRCFTTFVMFWASSVQVSEGQLAHLPVRFDLSGWEILALRNDWSQVIAGLLLFEFFDNFVIHIVLPRVLSELVLLYMKARRGPYHLVALGLTLGSCPLQTSSSRCVQCLRDWKQLSNMGSLDEVISFFPINDRRCNLTWILYRVASDI